MALSDFSKQQIQDCFNEMYDYINDYEIPDEDGDDSYAYLQSELEKCIISIPKDIYQKIIDFAEKELKPLSTGEAFGDMLVVMSDEDGEIELARQCLSEIMKRKEALFEFGRNELYPLLTENQS